MREIRACPICGLYGEEVAQRVKHGEKCPKCGLPADAVTQITNAHQRHADEELRKRYESLLEENQKLRQANSVMKDALVEIGGYLQYPRECGYLD